MRVAVPRRRYATGSSPALLIHGSWSHTMTMRLPTSALLVPILLALAAPVRGQSTVYASGCSGLNPTPTLSHTGELKPGYPNTITLSGAPAGGLLVLFVGTIRTTPEGDPLAIPLDGIAGVHPGCELNTSVALSLVRFADGSGHDTFSFGLPTGLGPDLNFQYAVWETTDPESIVMSEALNLHLALTAAPTPDPLVFDALPVGESSSPQIVTLSNLGELPLTVTGATIYDSNATDFSQSFVLPTPVMLAPAASTDVEVTFTPTGTGPRTARMMIDHAGLPPSFPEPEITLDGVGLGGLGQEILLHCGSDTPYLDGTFQLWVQDYGFTGGNERVTQNPVAGTVDDALYQTYRQGTSFDYALGVPPGDYGVTLHFWEPTQTQVDKRVFDVDLEGVTVIDDLDLFALVGKDVAYSETHSVSVPDGVLDVHLLASKGNAMLAAMEVRRQYAALSVTPGALDFGFVAQGEFETLPLTLENTGNQPLAMSSISFLVNGGAAHDLLLDLDGVQYQGDEGDVTLPSTFTLAAGASIGADLTFTPTEHGIDDVDVVFEGDFETQTLHVDAAGGVGGHPFLHVVIEPVGAPVDYDNDGFEDVSLDGSLSHTHEVGHVITGYEWAEGGTPFGSGPTPTASFSLGPHTVCLTIEDDNVPPESLEGCADFTVVTPMSVPGVLATYSDTSPAAPGTLLDGAPPVPDFAEVLATYDVAAATGTGTGVGGSDLTDDTYVRLRGTLPIGVADTYEFVANGGSDARVFVDGILYTAPVALGVGTHDLEARFAVDTLGDLPVEVAMGPLGGPYAAIDGGAVTHDETLDPPVINDMPSEGTTAGGNAIVISGLGFFPYDSVVVHWGSSDLLLADFTSIAAGSVAFPAPAHSAGTVMVTVETPLGISNARPFTYDEAGPPPVVFTLTNLATVTDPSCGAWGPDGRFWVSGLSGDLWAFTFDDDYNVVNQARYDGVKSLAANDVLGLAFDPFAPPGTTEVWVAHSQLFAEGGGAFTGPAPYPGFISKLSGPNYNTPVTVASGLPTSNHDHGVNAIVFDNSGDLLVSVGGNTNAGVKFVNIGDLPESPLSGAVVRLKTSRPDFDGTFEYAFTSSGLASDDQVDGELVDVIPGPTYEIVAPGVRNVLGMAYTTSGRLYGCDNGPNNGYGFGSTGLTTDTGTHVAWPDELLLLEYDHYYGHPNRNRGRTDEREVLYHNLTGATVPGTFTQKIYQLSSSTNGIDEYRATTFQSQLRGRLVLQRWDDDTSLVELAADGRSVVGFDPITPELHALAVKTGPGGAILGVDYSGDKLKVLEPVDASATGLTAYDIFPWRAPATGGASFVVGGENLGTLGTTSVTIGGLPATLSSVTSRRIKGTVPTNGSPTTALLDVVVTVGAESVTIPQAFRYLFEPGNEPGSWSDIPDLPQVVSETACAAIGTKIYVIGGDTSKTMRYDTVTGTWSSTAAAQRPFPGDHHAVQVWHDKLYVIGGVGNGADGKVQIYDPLTNLWTVGADMPWGGGSVSTALIGDLIYAAGGFDTGAFTVTDCAVYDPALDTWTTGLAPMVDGRNHAAAGTDGERLWVFGGRGPGSGDSNVVANGYADVQVYDPVTDTWDSSNLPGSELVPMPIGRGGTSRAVMYHGEFYVMGGETLTGPGATADQVYDRVDVYDPTTNTWRTDAPMTTARHGADPVLFDGRIWLLGGGFKKGHNPTAATEVFRRL